MTVTDERQPLDLRLQELQREFDAQVERPQGGDPLIGAFYGGLREVFESEGIDQVYAAAFARRPDLGAVHASGLARAAIQKLVLRRHNSNFPAQLTTREQYGALIQDILQSPANRREFRQDILTRSVQTCVAERGKGPKLLALFYAERFGNRPLNILDVGCGQNHLLKKMALTEHASDKRPLTFHYGSVEVNQDRYLTDRFNAVLDIGGLALGKGLGIDKESNKRKGEIEWIRSSFYLRELLEPTTLEEFDLMEACKPAGVSFRKLDILELAKSKDPSKLLGRFRPDIVIASAMLYQLTAQQRELARGAMRACVSPDGIIMYEDFARVDPRNASKLEFFEHWDPYTFRLIVEDMRDPNHLQEAVRWQNGRCEQAELGPGRLLVRDDYQTVEDLLRGKAGEV